MVLWDFNHRFGIFTTYNEILIKYNIFYIIFFAKIKNFFGIFLQENAIFHALNTIYCAKNLFLTQYMLYKHMFVFVSWKKVENNY